MATRIIELTDGLGAEPRRRFSDDDKARIVSEAMLPGASVGEVGRRHRVCSSLIYRWRRKLLRDGLAPAPAVLPAPAFVPVELAGAPAPAQPEPLGPGVVEVVGRAGQRVRLAPPVDARVLKAVLASLA
jgi:transposase